MNITIQSIDFDATEELKAFTEEKVKKLATYFDNITDIQVYMRVENAADKSLGNKRTEIKALVPGATLIAQEQHPTFEEGIDKCADQLRRQLIKYKEKMRG